MQSWEIIIDNNFEKIIVGENIFEALETIKDKIKDFKNIEIRPIEKVYPHYEIINQGTRRFIGFEKFPQHYK